MQGPPHPNQPLGLGPHYSFQPCQEAQSIAVLERSAQQVSRGWVKPHILGKEEVPWRKMAGCPNCPEGLQLFHLKDSLFSRKPKLHITSSSHISWHTPNSGLHPIAGFQRPFWNSPGCFRDGLEMSYFAIFFQSFLKAEG